MLEIGSIIDGKYKILNKIGQGGMSVVYLAMNERANKQWAIKEVRKDGVDNYEIVKQGLVAETEMLKRLHHPNLPSIVDVIDSDDTFLIVMDYIEGVPLSQVLRENGSLRQADVVKWAKQLCNVLGYLHARTPSIIYRDMKPGNIMLQPDGNTKLIDFGTAREFKPGREDDTISLGTQGYAAPEQFGLHQTDARTDVYCLGATMYHLVTGHNPCDPPYVMYPIRRWNEELSSGLEAIILKCTQRNPADRYQSCAELLYDLEHYRELDIENLKRQRNRVRLFALSAAICVVALLGTIGAAIGETLQRENTYTALIQRAQVSYENPAQAAQYYTQAAKLEATRAEAYDGLLKYIKQDGEMSEVEDGHIRALMNEGNGSAITNIDRFKESSSLAYANFAYELGIAYFSYYEGGSVPGQGKALYWLKEATGSPSLDSQKKNIAEKLTVIAEHYESAFRNNDSKGALNNSDPYGPQQFWADIRGLADRQATASVGNQYVEISLYSYVAEVLSVKYGEFLNAGISSSELLQGLQDAEDGLKSINPTSDGERKKIQEGLEAIASDRTFITSAATNKQQG